MVKIHTCFSQINGDPKPRHCFCKREVGADVAKEMVYLGEAVWVISYPPKGKAYESWNEIVSERATKTPRAQTLEKAHMMRASESDEDELERLDAYGQMTIEVWVALIVAWDGYDPFEGRAVLYMAGDDRTSCGQDYDPADYPSEREQNEN